MQVHPGSGRTGIFAGIVPGAGAEPGPEAATSKFSKSYPLFCSSTRYSGDFSKETVGPGLAGPTNPGGG